jgi:hypothetical protein
MTGNISTTGTLTFGIFLWNNDGANNTNTVNMIGNISTTGLLASGIYLYNFYNTNNTNNTNTANMTGNISTTGLLASGIYLDNYYGTNNTNTVNMIGNISTTGLLASGIYLYNFYGTNNTNTANMTGNISTTGSGASGIFLGNSNGTNNINTVNMIGNISTTGDDAYGIYLINDGTNNTNTANMTGNISTTGDDAYGIYLDNNVVGTNNTTTVNMTGNITTTGSYAIGINAAGSNSALINSGIISTSGYLGWGIKTTGINSTITNNERIATSGYGADGLKIYGNNSIINNNGTVTTSGILASGILSVGNNIIINNTGTIRIADGSSSAILLGNAGFYGANNNTVNLLKGSIIVGDIHADTSLTGVKLNINLGSGASYAYSVTGPWTISDLDNRPMVTGSAYAAGIGAQEAASEMLYQRTSSITAALDRRLRSYASEEADNQPYWLDVYYSDVSRNSGGNYSTRNAFSNYNYGLTAGFKLPVELTPLELVVNAQKSNLNIDSGNQKIDSTSLMVGVIAPSITEFLGAKLSAKALVGFANNDGDRKVMTNSLLYDGSRQIKSDYNSTYAVLGTALTKLYPINDRLTADALVGLDLATQHIKAYDETDYFAWQGRTLNQLQSRVQVGLDYRFNQNKASVFARVGAERRDLISGGTQDYSINGTNVSFNTNNSNDTYITAQLGIKAQLEKRVQLFAILNGLNSSDAVSSIQGNIGLRADF